MKIRLKRSNPADHFTMLPNEFLRSGGPTRLTLRGRALLSALVSFPDGWEISRKNIEEIAPELGTDALDTVRDELKTKRHLIISRERLGGGRFTWTWHVSIEPFPQD